MNTPTKKHRLPGWLYEALPYVYLATGVFVMFFLNNNWGIFSGIVLVLAGATVSIMRLTYRNGRNGKSISDEDSQILEVETLESGSTQLVWNKKYESGNAGIDDQHKELFEKGNNLLDAMYDGKSKRELMELTDSLLDHVESHFSSEEELMDAWGHPQAGSHKKYHQHLLEKARDLRENLEQGNMMYHDVFTFFINDLVLKHIVEEDRKFQHQI